MTRRNDNLKTVIGRYISILNTQNMLSLDKVAEIIVSMMSDLEGFIEDDMVRTARSIEDFEKRLAPLETKLSHVDGEVLGQVVRYVVGESLSKPGGLPLDIERLMDSSLKVEHGISKLSNDMLDISRRVAALEHNDSMGIISLLKKSPAVSLFVITIALVTMVLLISLAIP